MDDEGTPPALDRLLSSGASSPSYHPYALRGLQQTSTERPRDIVRAAVEHRCWPAGKTTASAPDLVQMLEENWYWRPATSKPSTPEIDDLNFKRQPSLHQQLGNGYDHDPQNPNYRAHRGGVPANVTAQQQQQQQHTEQSRTHRRSLSENLNNVMRQWSLGRDSDPAESLYSEDTPRSSQSAKNPEEVDSIGTWAHRVLRFNADDAGPMTPEPVSLSHVQPSKAARKQQGERKTHESEDDAAEAAWRWRFNRRWRTEQAKQLDPDFGMDGDDEDGWDDAMAYLDACGPGVHLQIGNTGRKKSLESSSSGGWGLLMDESQKDKGALASEEETATMNIASKAMKVQDLYKQQQKIERDVRAKWGEHAKVSMSWVGHHLKAVEIDYYGHFPFILVKLLDTTKAHRLLVRGRHAASVSELMRDTSAEVMQMCQKHRLPAVTVTLVGSGMLEWSKESARRVNVFQGHLERGCDPSIQSSDDVVRLAGALTRSSLAAPNRVTVNGEKLS